MLQRLLARLAPLGDLPLALRFMATAAIVCSCAGLWWLLRAAGLGAGLSLYLPCVPAVILSSLVFDRGCGLFAVLVGCVLSLALQTAVPTISAEAGGGITPLVFFVTIGLFTAALIEAFRHTIKELRTTESKLRDATRHRDLLLADINHRIKNHLASLSAVLALSRREIEDPRAREALDAAVQRLAVMGRVYTRLHASNQQVFLDAKEFLEGLCGDLSHTILALQPVTLTARVPRLQMEAQAAISLGLIINELVANAIKYAFPDDRPGRISIGLHEDRGAYRLDVHDDGVGMPKETPGGGSGMRLIRALTTQLGGAVAWTRDSGTRVSVTIPAEAVAGAEQGSGEPASSTGSAVPRRRSGKWRFWARRIRDAAAV